MSCATLLRRAWLRRGFPSASFRSGLGHADIKTTQVYTHYAPDEDEIAMVNAGFGGASAGSNLGSNVSAAQGKSARATPRAVGASPSGGPLPDPGPGAVVRERPYRGPRAGS
jgi:hypothetical protein